tara:strand:- start:5 stop:451 length:447 start_codon:yes stop_codon:yes gene_type:complete
MTEPWRSLATEKGHQTLDDAGIGRRLGALIYDALLAISILFFATAVLMPFTGGEAVSSGNLVYPVYLLLVVFAYFGGSWCRGGQTLGMRAWRLKVVNTDGRRVSMSQALIRFATAAGGLGLLGMLVDGDRKPWQDRLSDTTVVLLPRD